MLILKVICKYLGLIKNHLKNTRPKIKSVYQQFLTLQEVLGIFNDKTPSRTLFAGRKSVTKIHFKLVNTFNIIGQAKSMNRKFKLVNYWGVNTQSMQFVGEEDLRGPAFRQQFTLTTPLINLCCIRQIFQVAHKANTNMMYVPNSPWFFRLGKAELPITVTCEKCNGWNQPQFPLNWW